MLARDVAREFEQVEFAVEDLGASPMAERFGVDKYPALFVDDALVARPEDFYAWGGPETGKYVPWSTEENRRRFQSDVRRMIELRLRGEELESLEASSGEDTSTAMLPEVELTDLRGEPFSLDETGGRPMIVEFWATWCPPCLSTLSWMKELDQDEVSVVAIAVESTREDVDAVVERFGPPGRVVMGTPAVIEAFGGLPAIPALFIADSEGRIVRRFFGAPPDLHDQIEEVIARLDD